MRCQIPARIGSLPDTVRMKVERRMWMRPLLSVLTTPERGHTSSSCTMKLGNIATLPLQARISDGMDRSRSGSVM